MYVYMYMHPQRYAYLYIFIYIYKYRQSGSITETAFCDTSKNVFLIYNVNKERLI